LDYDHDCCILNPFVQIWLHTKPDKLLYLRDSLAAYYHSHPELMAGDENDIRLSLGGNISGVQEWEILQQATEPV